MPPRTGGSKHRRPSTRRLTKHTRLGAALVLAAALIAIGFRTGFGSEASAEPTAQAFLLDWEQGHYAQAAALTTGNSGQVAVQLSDAYTDLDATSTVFSMLGLVQHGSRAVESFRATVDLAQAGQQWTYNGTFPLVESAGVWRVDWAPSDINPHLGWGQRLAVVTSFAPRAQVEDAGGLPLLVASHDYHIGVDPGRLKTPAQTAEEFSELAGLNGQQVLGQINASPPGRFLSLLTVDQTSFDALWPKLSKVPGITYTERKERLFEPLAADAVGSIGTENAAELRAEGAAYQPGMTIGVSGLEAAYQSQLAGMPTTSIVAVDSHGQTVSTLWQSAGKAGTPVRTTLVRKVQVAASKALADPASSGELVAVDTRTGDIRALATYHGAGNHGVQLPSGGVLNARVAPGMAFSIVSAAALLGDGVRMNQSLPCQAVANVGGQTYSYQPSPPSKATLATDFAAGCGTAFASASQRLNAPQLAAVERGFGIGAAWSLQVPAFSGSASGQSGQASVAAQVTGTGGVLMSPLGMALIAAEVATGTGHAPVLTGSDQSAATWRVPLSTAELKTLQHLMRVAVKSGTAKGANLTSGKPVYGQAGITQTGPHAYVSWFVGYRGNMAVAVLEAGATPAQAAAAVAATFLSSLG